MWMPMSVRADVIIYGLKCAVCLLFLWAYFKSHRRSALFLGGAWILSGDLPLKSNHVGNPGLDPLLMGMATSATIFGIMELIREERGRGPPKSLVLTLPLIPFLYGALETALGTNFGGTYVTSGLLLIAGGGTFIEFLKDVYRDRAILMGSALITSGIASMMYPLLDFRGVLNSRVTVYGSLFIAILMLFAYYRLVFSRNFVYLREMTEIKDSSPLKPGVKIISPRKFQEIEEKLEGFPVLAFLRSLQPKKGWITYTISSVEGKRTIHPTSLYKITQTTAEYLRESERKGIRGVVLLDGLEVLHMYNGFESLLKFLSNLRDIVAISNASLIVVTEKEAWKSGEWKLLQRILE